jgi:type IV pilus assembly protein PilQ
MMKRMERCRWWLWWVLWCWPSAAWPQEAADFGDGGPITLDFQDIDVRAALQILAEFNDFSLVVGDSVAGRLTLRLDAVPWEQALDLVLKPRGLDQRRIGQVLYVAPTAELAQAELDELEAQEQRKALAPLVTEFIELNYAVAIDLLPLLRGEGEAGGILTARGSAAVDQRTNTLIVQDVQAVLDEIRALLVHLDVPVRQVLIEARIVNASTSFSKALGIRWGGERSFVGAGADFTLSGSLEAVAGGERSPGDGLLVDLGIDKAPASIALGYAGNSGLLQLELSALEASGEGEVIAQPKVTTQDQQAARIESGLQIPYQAQAGGTAGGSTTEFVTAALSLQVTPQITPDGRIIMLLDIHQDSVVPGTEAVPAIATNAIATRVLVNDGDTVVLGGVFREEESLTVSKTPLLADLPYLGSLFRRTDRDSTKTELLIFITPSIIRETLSIIPAPNPLP